jgi:hypothetical protein
MDELSLADILVSFCKHGGHGETEGKEGFEERREREA